jgi:hypothetical protein
MNNVEVLWRFFAPFPLFHSPIRIVVTNMPLLGKIQTRKIASWARAFRDHLQSGIPPRELC